MFQALVLQPKGVELEPVALDLLRLLFEVADGDYFECLVWRNASGSPEFESDPQTWFAIIAIEFAAFGGALVTVEESIADSD